VARELDRVDDGLGADVHVDVELERRGRGDPGLQERLALRDGQRQRLAVRARGHDVRDVARGDELGVGGHLPEVEAHAVGGHGRVPSNYVFPATIVGAARRWRAVHSDHLAVDAVVVAVECC